MTAEFERGNHVIMRVKEEDGKDKYSYIGQDDKGCLRWVNELILAYRFDSSSARILSKDSADMVSVEVPRWMSRST